MLWKEIIHYIGQILSELSHFCVFIQSSLPAINGRNIYVNCVARKAKMYCGLGFDFMS